MAQEKLPVGKVERASKFLKTGLKLGRNYVSYYGQKALLQHPERDSLDRANASDIWKEFSELKGSALKVAQMLSMDNVTFSPAFTTILQKAQYSVPPMSGPLSVQAFTKSLGKAPEEVFDKFNPMAIKAASMGQVHQAELNGQKLAVKIQYPGVGDSIKSDLRIVKQFAPSIINASADEIEPFFAEVQTKLLEEADYKLELRSAMGFAASCGHMPGILFPTYYPQFSAERVLTMSWMEGMHLKEFLATAPDPALVQLAAQRIWDLYDYQVHVLKHVHADPHPGNFLFMPDGSVGVIDFGCTKALTPELYEDYFSLADPELNQDMGRGMALMRKLEIIRPSDSPAKVELLYSLFTRLIELLTRPLHAGTFNFNNPSYYEEIAAIGVEVSKLRELRGNKEFLFINRTFFGLFTLMQQMNATVHTVSPFNRQYAQPVA